MGEKVLNVVVEVLVVLVGTVLIVGIEVLVVLVGTVLVVDVEVLSVGEKGLGVAEGVLVVGE